MTEASFLNVFPPNYPTIEAVTVCKANGDYGTWYISKNGVSIDRQNECVNARTKKTITQCNASEFVIDVIGQLQVPEPEMKPMSPDDASLITCRKNALNDLYSFQRFCRKPDMTNVTGEYMLKSCETGTLDLKCFNSEGNFADVSLNTKDCVGGMYYCDFKPTCTQCSRKKEDIENKLNDIFLNKECPHFAKELLGIGKTCKGSMLNTDDSVQHSEAIKTCKAKNGLMFAYCEGDGKRRALHITRGMGWECKGIRYGSGNIKTSDCLYV